MTAKIYTNIVISELWCIQYWCLPANCGIFRICAKKAKLIIYVAGVSVCFDFSSEMLFFSFVAVANQFFFFQYMIYRMLYAQHLFSRSNGDMPLKNEIKLVVSLFSVKIMMKNRMQWKIGPDLMMKKQNHTKLISSSYKWNCAGKKVTTTLAISQYKLLFQIKIIFFFNFSPL